MCICVYIAEHLKFRIKLWMQPKVTGWDTCRLSGFLSKILPDIFPVENKQQESHKKHPPLKEKPQDDVSIEIKICMFAIVWTTQLVSGMLQHNIVPVL